MFGRKRRERRHERRMQRREHKHQRRLVRKGAQATVDSSSSFQQKNIRSRFGCCLLPVVLSLLVPVMFVIATAMLL